MKKKLLGQYRPKCTKEGKFEAVQQSGSVLFCVDEETGIPDFKTSKQIGTGLPDCSKKGMINWWIALLLDRVIC